LPLHGVIRLAFVCRRNRHHVTVPRWRYVTLLAWRARESWGGGWHNKELPLQCGLLTSFEKRQNCASTGPRGCATPYMRGAHPRATRMHVGLWVTRATPRVHKLNILNGLCGSGIGIDTASTPGLPSHPIN
jgi:hypothetical protein